MGLRSRPATARVAIGILAAVVVAVDQITKTWALHHTIVSRHVLGPVWLTLSFNRGAAFNLGSGVAPVMEAAVVLLVVALLLFGRRASRQAGWPVVVGLGLLVGGAVGNLSDRLFRHIPLYPGAVIDFIDAVRIGHRDYWPVFNVADASVVVGAIGLALSYSKGRR